MEPEIAGRLSRNQLLKLLEQNLSPKRIQHILGVEKMAIRLAEHYNTNIMACRTAALYHDLAKSYNLNRCLEIIDKYGWPIDEMEKDSTNLLHSKVGELLAAHEYGIIDREILNAISYHTTGKANMSSTEKIIFVADAIEENRDYDSVEELRESAFVDLDSTLLRILNETIIYLIRKEQKIHPNTLMARNFLLNKEV